MHNAAQTKYKMHVFNFEGLFILYSITKNLLFHETAVCIYH